MEPTPLPAFDAVTRRAFLRRIAAFGAVAVFPAIAACGGDEEVFVTTTGATTTTAGTLATTTTTTTAATTTSTGTTGALPAGSEMLVKFRYSAPTGGEPVRNPYVAVWVEDADGELVDTIALWWQGDAKGAKWLADLRAWTIADGSAKTVDAMTSPTRTPGSYTLAWDLTGRDGVPIAPGEYRIAIEAAREHGPHSLVRTPVTITGEALVVELGEDQEIRDAKAELHVV